MIPLPGQNRIWTQPNTGDTLGQIYVSKGLDLEENPGKVRVGKRLVLNTGSVDQGTILGVPVAFKQFDVSGTKFVYAIMSSNAFSHTGSIYKTSSAAINGTNDFSVISVSSSPTKCVSEYSDMELFGSHLWVTESDNTVCFMDGSGTWTNTSVGGTWTTNRPHMMCSFNTLLYISATETTILSVDDTGSFNTTLGTPNTLDLGLDTSLYQITFLRAGANIIWIGVLNKSGGSGYMYKWDGASNTPTSVYRLTSTGPLACVIKDDVPYIIDTQGDLLAYNGGTFIKLDGLNKFNKRQLFQANFTSNARFIHPNGMAMVNGKIHILINGRSHDGTATTTSTFGQIETIPSGVWEYDEDRGLVHKYSIGLSHSADSLSDMGQTKLLSVGAIAEVFGNHDEATDGSLLVGAGYFADTTTTQWGIFYDNLFDTIKKSGYLITTKQYAVEGKYNSPSVQNMWQNIYTMYKNFINSTDKIVLKYRTSDIPMVEATITWTSTSTFTTTTNVSSYWTSGTGGEVEVILGVGSGMCAHITSIVNNSGTYTITIDETVTGASNQTSLARFQMWKKISVMTDANIATYDQATAGVLANWIQLKVWMLFTGKNEMEQMIIINSPYNPAN